MWLKLFKNDQNNFSGHFNNVSVDMLNLTTANNLTSSDLKEEELSSIHNVVSCPGCLCPADDACPQLLSDMICLSQQNSVSLIKKLVNVFLVKKVLLLKTKLLQITSESLFR